MKSPFMKAMPFTKTLIETIKANPTEYSDLIKCLYLVNDFWIERFTDYKSLRKLLTK